MLDLVLPAQSPGHCIHGPLPVIHVFNDRNVNGIRSVFDIKLDRFRKNRDNMSKNYNQLNNEGNISRVIM